MTALPAGAADGSPVRGSTAGDGGVTTASPPTGGRRLLAPGLTVAALTAATLAVNLRDPHVAGSWGVCPSVALFGVWCPACGGLRAVHDLGHGEVLAAASSNLLFLIALPFVLLGLALWGYAAWTGRRPRLPAGLASPPVLTLLAVVTVGFTVLRNLPAGSWLAP